MFWDIFKNFEATFGRFIRVSGSFADFDSYFKAPIHILKLQLGKIVFGQ